MTEDVRQLALALQQSGRRCVLAITGGGTSAAAWLLGMPGASAALLEVVVPYHDKSLAEFLGHRPTASCSLATAGAMAQRAAERAAWLVPGEPVVGLGATASLVSHRPKRGEHRLHVAVKTGELLRGWSLVLAKGARDRAGEEDLAARVILHLLGKSLQLPCSLAVPLLAGESVQEAGATISPLGQWFASGLPVRLRRDGQWCAGAAENRPRVVLPGAFNPLHQGHWGLAAAAAEFLEEPVVFELSVSNVDKLDMNLEETRRRLAQFADKAEVWVTRAARFLDKVRLFPGATFVVGVDTAQRIVSPRYHDDDPAQVLAALQTYRQARCRFLVAGRAMPAVGYQGLQDVAVPAEFADLFVALPVERFRCDAWSTVLRQGIGDQP